MVRMYWSFFFFFQAEDGIRDYKVTGVQTCALPIFEKITPNPQQPRTSFDPAGIEELAASIRRHGVLQPIVVSRQGDGYQLVAGHRRGLPPRAAGQNVIPAGGGGGGPGPPPPPLWGEPSRAR